MIVQSALQDDVDVVGLSCLSGAHLELFSEVMRGIHDRNMDNVNVIAGGVIPDDDIPELEKIGVKAVFGPGTPTTEIVAAIEKLVKGTK